MPLNVFLSYSTSAEDQVIVWRLQTLAASHGIDMYVPARDGFKTTAKTPVLSRTVENAIDHCDCILAIITSRTSRVVERELNYALEREKLIIPLVESSIADAPPFRRFDPIFRFDPGQPTAKVESEVISFLKAHQVSKDNQKALGALVAIGLGMLALSALSEG
jgi:hypothetical protein